MSKQHREKRELFVRLRDFGAANREAFPESSVGGQSFLVLVQVVEHLNALGTEKRLAVQESRQVKLAKRRAVYGQLKTLAHTARGVARTTPGIDKHFRMPARRSDTDLIETARTFVAAAVPVEARFIELGMASTFVADLREALTQLEQSRDRRLSSRKGTSEANAGIALAIDRGFEAVRMLDIVVPNTLASDPVRLAGWTRVRRTEGSARAAVPSSPPIVEPAVVSPDEPAAAPAEDPPAEGLRRVS